MEYTESTTSQERPKAVTWTQFQDAIQVFSPDLALVGHAEDTEPISPYDQTLPEKEGHRQYNLVQLPKEMTEPEFLKELQSRSVIKVGCIDKDASGPSYQNRSEDEQKKLIQILVAGGGIQLDETRLQALHEILTYLSAKAENTIERVEYSGHNHKCGYVTHSLSNTPLPDKIGSQPAGDEENSAMLGLIYEAGEKVGIEKLFPGKVEYLLEMIDREGHIETDAL